MSAERKVTAEKRKSEKRERKIIDHTDCVLRAGLVFIAVTARQKWEKWQLPKSFRIRLKNLLPKGGNRCIIDLFSNLAPAVTDDKMQYRFSEFIPMIDICSVVNQKLHTCHNASILLWGIIFGYTSPNCPKKRTAIRIDCTKVYFVFFKCFEDA